MTPRERRARELATEHLPLAVGLAARYFKRRGHLEFNDVLGYATIGLMQAARRFDPTRGAKFSSYAYPRIVGAIKDGFRTEYGGRDWSDALSQPRGGLEEYEARAVTEIDESHGEQMAALREAWSRLSARERTVIACTFGGGTVLEAGGLVGLTKSGADLVRLRALDKLRRFTAAKAA